MVLAAAMPPPTHSTHTDRDGRIITILSLPRRIELADALEKLGVAVVLEGVGVDIVEGPHWHQERTLRT